MNRENEEFQTSDFGLVVFIVTVILFWVVLR
jgi:hypothetical protein